LTEKEDEDIFITFITFHKCLTLFTFIVRAPFGLGSFSRGNFTMCFYC